MMALKCLIDSQDFALRRTEWTELTDQTQNDDVNMLDIGDARESSAMNSAKCVKRLFAEQSASNNYEPDFDEIHLDSDQNDDMNASTRSLLKDQLNGNISYSYRTHFYLHQNKN